MKTYGMWNKFLYERVRTKNKGDSDTQDETRNEGDKQNKCQGSSFFAKGDDFEYHNN